MGDAPFCIKFVLKVAHPRSKNADFDSAYNVSIVREQKSSGVTNRKSTMGFSVSYKWSVYVIPKSPKGV